MSVSIERSDRTLLRALTRRLRAGQARAGCKFGCRPECIDCCVGPFPITRLDAHRLRLGLRTLRKCRPARARALDVRVVSCFDRIAAVFPSVARRRLLTTEDEDRLLEELSNLACPALDPSRRRCDLYPYRPISCRTFGPPVRIGGESLPLCDKCVAGLTAGQIERGRVDVDPDDREGELLLALAPDLPDEGETLVVFALAS